eukprot:m.1655533 g.1655533  ORF g.1655533 m.1655533 type:complete len:65 (+) comp104656_c0_seq1:89-283(+)
MKAKEPSTAICQLPAETEMVSILPFAFETMVVLPTTAIMKKIVYHTLTKRTERSFTVSRLFVSL